MGTRSNCVLASLGLLIAASSGQAAEDLFFEVSGKATLEGRAFFDDPRFEGQSQESNLSATLEPNLYWAWNDDRHSVVFTPFFRVDENDDERSHADVRELLYTFVHDDYEFRAGLGKVFWGVTEFQHLVDVINQSDSVEDIDNEDKLGQPMLSLSMVRDWGTLDAFVLPGFRERTFVGREGRLRPPVSVDIDNPAYESEDEDGHVDVALRWSQTYGDYDIGLHGFHGTNRDPQLRPQANGQLQPYYAQMTQFGLDAQATLDSWLLKAESVWRDEDKEDYWVAQWGFEYSFYGIAESDADLGVLLEYGWDERGEDGGIMQNDVGVGLRLALNDEASSELLAGVIYDRDHGSQSFNVEASRRLGDRWKINLDARIFDADEAKDPLSAFDSDDHLQVTLERYF